MRLALRPLLGVCLVLSLGACGGDGAGEHADVAVRAASALSIFRQALVTNVLNPKVAVFFIAFLPPFVPAGAESYAATIALLSAVFIVAGYAFLIAVALLADSLRRPLGRLPGLRQVQRYLVASTFGGMAAWLATQR